MLKDRFIHTIFSETGEDLEGQRLRLLLALLPLLILGGLAALVLEVLGQARTEVLVSELLVLLLFGFFYGFARRSASWTAYATLFTVMAVSLAIPARGAGGPLPIAAVVPVILAPLIAPAWLVLPVAGIQLIAIYLVTVLTHAPALSPAVYVVFAAAGAIAWLSGAVLEHTVQRARSHTERLEQINRRLEDSSRLLERNSAELERRTGYMQAAAEVAGAASSILDPQELTGKVVESIRRHFDLYYVGLFLMDRSGEWAVLRAGTGQAGEAMLGRGHRIRTGQGMIGWAASQGQARVAQDVHQDPEHLPTAELPETRSEAAVPMRSRGQVLGALSIQSVRTEAFDEDLLTALQIMADQVAVAIDNANLFSEAQASLETTRLAYGEMSRQAWLDRLRSGPLGFHRDARGLAPVQTAPDGNGSAQTIAVPIRVRGNVIGTIQAYKPASSGAWTPDEASLLETLIEQLGIALDSARLHEEAHQRAEREKMIGEATSRMRESLDIDAVLRTAAEEIYLALGLHDVSISLQDKPAGSR